jgi:ABC-type Zn uptake system ZnuABC Zn-binding protein ZnuA
MKFRSFLSLLLGLPLLTLLPSYGQEKLPVATLHPVLTDLVNHIGGSVVQVYGIMKPGADAHTFSPTAADMKLLMSSKVMARI